MTAYLFNAPAGFAGQVTRMEDSTIEPGFFAAAAFPTAFGQPVKVDGDGKFVLMGAGSAAADFYGLLIREVPSTSGTLSSETLESGVPNPLYAHGLLTRGYANVVCVVGDPIRGGVVYVRVVDAGAGFAVGQFEADADGVNNVALVGVVWAANGKDATNIAELRVAR